MVRDYIATEDCGVSSKILLESDSDKRANMLLEQTTVRIGNRFTTGLLWRHDYVELPDSYMMAIRRLECLERRMHRNETLKENIHRQIAEYQQKGYAHCASTEELESADPRRIWYLPLGAVTNPNKPGKVRLIWDARVNGISLNSVLLSGPDLLTPLPSVLFRFRQYSVAISSDIKEMFHQLRINDRDKHSQRFLWRESSDKEPKVFLMDVATFGATCSPTSAQFVKNKKALEFTDKFPRAVQGIIQNHYVDDYLDSFETVDEAKSVAETVQLIHSKEGFTIHNWISNSKSVLDHLGEVSNADIKHLTSGKGHIAERVLGMLWLPESDELGFSTSFTDRVRTAMKTCDRPTKRMVLKTVMSLFDPLAFLATFLVHGKILLQDIWRTGIKWDDSVNDKHFERWLRWIDLIKQVSSFRIPRCYFHDASAMLYDSLQAHVFVDASEAAYSAALYFRIRRSDGSFQCSLVAAKTKVAPLKHGTIPRLELMAALLGARLLSFVVENHTISVRKRFLWTDSATVLSWICSDHRTYRQFVACRVGEISSVTNESEWRWVPSKFNVADEATKWGKGPCFDAGCRWYVGPDFLCLPEDDWPKQPTTVATKEEIRPCLIHQETLPTTLIHFDRFSSWNRLSRSSAYLVRAITFWKRKKIGVAGTRRLALSQEEIREGETLIWKLVQREVYADELVLLSRNELLPEKERMGLLRSSNLYTLSPKLGQDGLIRLDGRIGATELASSNAEHDALTTNHFLLGSSNGLKQPVSTTTDKYSIRNSWDLIQRNLDCFWTRWIREYLPTLTKRTKWFDEVRPVQPGDLVVIIDEARRNSWIRGRVLEAIASSDGRVRQVLVQTSSGIFRRPVSKLAVLDVGEVGKDESSTHPYGRGYVAAETTRLATRLSEKTNTDISDSKEEVTSSKQ
ncbi:uncharacterized protein LOC131434039 [Malaya genurostris]|uniref:uncharacterized protein LOC131434039 n=1 Tax=Malaya genurostris TaxID=325434 RepID=UPI0026F3CC1E|nr:uncharacterized protein LOC131434039 [Malaya genurostris]